MKKLKAKWEMNPTQSWDIPDETREAIIRKVLSEDEFGNKILDGPGPHYCAIPFGTNCVCNHSHSIVMGIEAESREPYEFVMRFPNGEEIRRKLTHEEWVELYVGIVPRDVYHPENPEMTPEILEQHLEDGGCTCKHSLKEK